MFVVDFVCASVSVVSAAGETSMDHLSINLVGLRHVVASIKQEHLMLSC